MEAVALLKGDMQYVKAMRARLLEVGIACDVVPEDCTSGACSSFFLAVAKEQAEEAASLLDADWRSELSDEAQAAAATVIDFDAEEMTCPACLTKFATGPEECPDCGLFLGAPE